MGDVSKTGTTGEGEKAELNLQIGHDDKGSVIVNFGRDVSWLTMPGPDAVNFALSLLGHAGAKLTVNIDDSMIERAKEFSTRPLQLRSSDSDGKDAWMRALLNYAINGQET